MSMEIILPPGTGSPITPIGYSGRGPLTVSAGYNGAIIKGRPAVSLQSLLGIYSGETVLIQHLPSTGQIRLVSMAQPPVFYLDDFEAEAAAALAGQDYWVDASTAPGSIGRIQAAPNIVLAGRQSLAFKMIDVGAGATIFQRPVTVPAATALRFAATFYLNSLTSGVVAGDSFNFGTDQFVIQIDVAGGGQFALMDGAGSPWGFKNPVALNTPHRVELVFDATGAITSWTIDGVAAPFGPMPAIGTPTMMRAYGFSALPLVGNPSAIFDDVVLCAATPANSGILEADGAGERLEAQTRPIDLTQVGLAVDAGAAINAQVEIFAVGF